MGTEVLSSELLSVEKNTKKSTKNKDTKAEQKEGSSLFDKLLQNAANKNTATQEKPQNDVVSQQQPKVQTKKTLSNHNQPTNKNESNPQKNLETTPSKTQVTPKQSSLLDRMVQDIKTKTNDTKSIEVSKNVVLNEEKKSVKFEHNTQTTNITTKTKIVDTSKETKIDEKLTKNSSTEQKTKNDDKPLSLMDRLIEKNKVDTSKTEIKNNEKVDTPKTKENNPQTVKLKSEENLPIAQVKKDTEKPKVVETIVNTKQTTHIKKDETVEEKTTTIEKINTTTLSEPQVELKKEIKVEPLKEEAKDVEAPSNSLMDRLIQDASKKATQDTTDKVTIPVSKEIIEDITVKSIQEPIVTPKENTKKESSSMLDRMVQTIQSDKKEQKEESVSKSTSTISTTAEKTNVDKKNLVESNLNDKQVLQANRYLQEQQKSKTLVSENAKKEAKEVLSNEQSHMKSEEKIQKSAKILELNPTKVDIEEVAGDEHQNVDQKKLEQYVFKKSFTALNRAYLNEDISTAKVKEQVVVQATSESDEKTEQIKEVELRVERSSVEVFTSRVIAAKQKVETFMSDLARQMYQNYKPPITAFRINLNPANLGSIAIMIKSNKSENSLSVSMNMNQTNTFETISENKSTLQSAIAKNFSTEAQISLDLAFSDNSDNQFEAHYEQEKQNLKQESTTHNIAEDNTIDTNQNTQYM